MQGQNEPDKVQGPNEPEEGLNQGRLKKKEADQFHLSKYIEKCHFFRLSLITTQ